MEKINSDKKIILQALKEGYHLSKLQMLQKFRCWNSGHVIYMLRKEGHKIKTTMVKNEFNGKRFATYHF